MKIKMLTKNVALILITSLIVLVQTNLFGIFGSEKALAIGDSSKKGVASSYYANNDLSKLTVFNGSWFYNWGCSYSADSSKIGNMEYVPMIRAAGDVTTANLDSLKSGKASGKYKNLLSFNEPDLSSQASMSVQQCIDLWPKLMDTGLRLGSPATTTPTNGWLDSFMTEANNRGYRVDFITLHFYPDFTDPNSVEDVKNKITEVYNKYKKPIWITEIGTVDINAWGIKTKATPTQQAADEYMKKIVAMLDSLSFVERYSWFTDKCPDDAVTKYSSLYSSDNNLTNMGKIYASTDTVSTPVDKTPYFMIVNKNSGKALDLIGGDTTSGARINQWAYDYNSANQRWAILPAANNHFKIISSVSQKAFSIVNGSVDNGAQLHDWEYTGSGDDQMWDFVDVGNGWFKIRNVKSGKMLEIAGSSTSNDAKAQQNADNGGQANQLWRLQAWGDYNIKAASGKYVCVKDKGSTNGSRIIQYDYENNPWFKWRVENVGDGLSKVSSLNALSRVLCVNNSSTTAGAYLHLWDYNSANVGDQKVKLVPQTDGKFKFYFAHDGQTWDVPGGQTGNNVEVDQYTDNNNTWQKFTLERTN